MVSLGIDEDVAILLIPLQQKMGVCGRHAVHRGELFRHKVGDLADIGALYNHSQVVPAGDQEYGTDLWEAVETGGDIVEAGAALGGDRDVDESGHALVAGPLPIDHGLVAADHAAPLPLPDLPADF